MSRASGTDDRTDPPPSRNLGRFTLERLLGRGGMGEVWLAHDPLLDRKVAVKVLHGSGHDPEVERRFQREIRALAALNHPAIAQIHEAGSVRWPTEESSVLPYLVLEYVEGETLDVVLGRGPFPKAEAVRLTLELLEGLAVAHDHLLAHRDIKPANVMLTPDGGVKLLDLGLAKALSPATETSPGRPASLDEPYPDPGTTDPDLTQEGRIVGTPAYMAPEQLRGRASDARSDVWMVGTLLVEMLTGRRLFVGATPPEVFAQIDVFSFRPELLPESSREALAPILERCLAVDPRDRYHHARDLAHDLASLARRPEKARPRPRNLQRASLALAFVAALLSVVALVSWRRGEPQAAVRGARLLARPGWAPAVTPAGDRIVRASGDRREIWVVPLDHGAGQRIWTGDRPAGNVCVAPDGQAALFDLPDPDGHRAVWEVPLAGGAARRITSGWMPAISPGGDLVACVETKDGRSHNLVVTRRDGSARRWAGVIRGPLAPAGLVFFPDGRSVLVAVSDWYHRGELRRVDLESGEERRLVAVPGQASHGLQLLRDGRTALWCVQPDADSGPVPGLSDLRRDGFRPIVPGPGRFSFASLSADGKTAVAQVEEVRHELVRVAVTPGEGETRSSSRLFEGSAGSQPRVSRAGTIAFSGADRGIWTWRAGEGHATPLVATGDVSTNPAWSPDGALLAYTCLRNGATDIWVVKANGADPKPLTNDPASDFQPVVLAGGRQVVFVSDREGEEMLYWTSLAGGKPRRLLAERVANPAVSVDGRRLAVVVNRGAQDITLRLYELLPGPAVGRLLWEHSDTRSQWAGLRPRFSPDGRWLAFEKASPEGEGGDVFAVEVDEPQAAAPVRLTRFDVPVSTTNWFDWIDASTLVLCVGHQESRIQVLPDADRWLRRAMD